MKNIKVYVLSLLAITFVSVYFVSCDSDNDDSLQTSAITVRLVDAPGDYKEVNIDVRDIMIKNSTDTDDQGWIGRAHV